MDGIELDDTVRVSKGRPRHKPVKASQLRSGDLMRCGVSTNYVKVANVKGTLDGRMAVTIYNGAIANANPYQTFGQEDEVSLSTHGMSDAELAEDREPWCNHDAPAVRNGVCECGAKVSQS
jgi:hypothetical protein